MRFYSEDNSWGDILPRYLFLESIFQGKKVLEIGCRDGTGAIFIREHGASQVVGVDIEGAALRSAMKASSLRGVSFQSFDGVALDFPSASFDVVIDFDLATSLEPERLAEVERILKPSGLFVTTVRTPKAFSVQSAIVDSTSATSTTFEEFMTFLQDRFSQITVIGQLPFLGFSIGWMGAESQDLPLEMDSSLLAQDTEDVAFYILVCGRRAQNFESQSLIQLPFQQVMKEFVQLAQRGQSSPEELEPDSIEEFKEEDSVAVSKDVLAQLLGESKDRLHDSKSLFEKLNKIVQQRTGMDEEIAQLRFENDQYSHHAQAMEERLLSLDGELEQSRGLTEEIRSQLRSREEEIAEKLSWLEVARSEVEKVRQQLQEREKVVQAQAKTLEEQAREVSFWEERAGLHAEEHKASDLLKIENVDLKRSIERLETKLSERQQEKNFWEQERIRLVAVEQKQRTTIEKSTLEAEELKRERTKLGRQYEEETRRATLLEKELAERSTQLKSMEKEKYQREREVLGLQRANKDFVVRESSWLAEREVLKRELADRQDEVLVLRRQLTSETGKIAAMEGRLSEQEIRNRDLESDFVAMINRLEDGQSQDHDRRSFIVKLQARLAEQQKDQENYREKITDLTRELYQARKQGEELGAAIELLRMAISEQEQSRKSLEEQILTYQVSADRSRPDWEKKCRDAEMKVASKQRELAECRDEMISLEQQAEQLRSEINDQKNENEQVWAKVEEAKDRLTLAKAENQRLLKVEQELAWFPEEVTRLNDQLGSKQEELDETSLELEQTQIELFALQEEWEVMQRTMKQAATKAQPKEKPSEEVSEIQKLRHELQERGCELDEARRLVERERSQSRLLSEQLDRLRLELQQRMGPAKEELVLTLEREQTLQTRVATLQKQLGELEERTSTELSALSEQVRRRERQMESMTGRMAELEEQAQTARLQAEHFKQRLEGENAGAQNRGLQNAELSPESRYRVEEMERILAQAQQEFDLGGRIWTEQMNKLQQELAIQREEAQRMRVQLELNSKIGEALSEREQKIKTLESQLQQRSEQLNQLKLELASHKAPQ